MIPVRLRTTTTATTTPSSIGFTRPIESNLLRGGDQQLEQIGCGWDFLTQRCKDIFQLGWCNACVDIGNVFYILFTSLMSGQISPKLRFSSMIAGALHQCCTAKQIMLREWLLNPRLLEHYRLHSHLILSLIWVLKQITNHLALCFDHKEISLQINSQSALYCHMWLSNRKAWIHPFSNDQFINN